MRTILGVVVALCIFNVTTISATETTQEMPSIFEKVAIETIVPEIDESALSSLYTCKEDERQTNENIVELSVEDAKLLMQVSRAEGGPSLDGQLYSMRTILNRVESDDFPNTIYEVVSQKTPSIQFEVFYSGAYKTTELNSDSHVALAMIEGGWDETEGALYWEASTNSNHSWHATHLTFIKEVEGQRYYK